MDTVAAFRQEPCKLEIINPDELIILSAQISPRKMGPEHFGLSVEGSVHDHVGAAVLNIGHEKRFGAFDMHWIDVTVETDRGEFRITVHNTHTGGYAHRYRIFYGNIEYVGKL